MEVEVAGIDTGEVEHDFEKNSQSQELILQVEGGFGYRVDDETFEQAKLEGKNEVEVEVVYKDEFVNEADDKVTDSSDNNAVEVVATVDAKERIGMAKLGV